MRSMAVPGRRTHPAGPARRGRHHPAGRHDPGQRALRRVQDGGAAVERLAAGESGILVGQLKGVVAATRLDDVAGKKKPLYPSLFVLARAMSS